MLLVGDDTCACTSRTQRRTANERLSEEKCKVTGNIKWVWSEMLAGNTKWVCAWIDRVQQTHFKWGEIYSCLVMASVCVLRGPKEVLLCWCSSVVLNAIVTQLCCSLKSIRCVWRWLKTQQITKALISYSYQFQCMYHVLNHLASTGRILLVY